MVLNFASPLLGSEEEANWREDNPDGYELHESTLTTGSTDLHIASGINDIEHVKILLKEKPKSINTRDINGWMPLHEAARGGNIEVINILLENGADINARTKDAEGKGASGGSVLWLANNFYGEDHEVIQYLVSKGAKKFAPGQINEEL
jgi:ankyrin repeat protein